MARRRRRAALPRLSRRDRRRRPRPPAPRAARRRARAARPALARVQPLLDRADGAARRAAVRAVRRRAVVLLQLRRGSDRGRAEVRAQGVGQAGRRRARGLVPRPHAAARSPSRASLRSAPRSSRCSPASRSRSRTTSRRSRRRSTDETGCILLEPVQGEGGIHPARLAVRRSGTHARRRRRRAARLRRGADGRRPHGHVLRVRAARRPPRRGRRSPRASRTGCRSAACSSPTRLPEDSCPATTRARSAATPSPARQPSQSCDTIDDELLAGVVAHGATIAAAGCRTSAGAGCCSPSTRPRPAADVVADCLERGLLVGTAGEQLSAADPAADHLTADELDQGLAILEEVLA